MSHWYWIAVFISVIAFGGMSKHTKTESIPDLLWIILYVIAYISAIFLSGGRVIGVITATALLLGNGLLWSFIW